MDRALVSWCARARCIFTRVQFAYLAVTETAMRRKMFVAASICRDGVESTDFSDFTDAALRNAESVAVVCVDEIRAAGYPSHPIASAQSCAVTCHATEFSRRASEMMRRAAAVMFGSASNRA